jgi:Nif-specific regulatory protein
MSGGGGMADKLNEIREKIRAIIDEEQKPVVEIGRIVTGTSGLETALKAATAERRTQKDPTKKAVLTNLIGAIHFQRGHYAEAEKEALKSTRKKGVPDSIRALAYSTVAFVYLRRDELVSAEAYCKKALALTEEKDDQDVLVFILNTVGAIHFHQEKYPIALEYYQLYQKVAERMGNPTQIVSALVNIALTFRCLGKEDKTLKCLLQARKIALEIEDSLRLGYILSYLGSYYLNQGDLRKALLESQKSIRIFKEVGHRRMFAYCHIDIARIHLELGKPDVAAKHAAKALAYAEELEQKSDLAKVHELMGLVLAAQNNPLASTRFTKSIELYRELRHEGNAEGIEFTMLEYGKYLLARNESEGADLIREAADMLKIRPATIRVKKAREELKELLLVIPKESRPSEEEKVEKIEGDRDNFRKILEITKAINSETEIERVLGRIIDTAIETSGAERGFIVLVQKGQWKFAAQKNFFGDITSKPDYQVIHEIIAKVVSEHTAFTVGNIRQSDSLDLSISKRPSTLRAVFTFPLAIKDKVIGAVYLDSRYAVVDLSQDTINFMSILMEQVGLIIEKARLYEEVRVLSEKRGEKLEETRFDLEQKQHELELRFSYKNIVGKSPKMQKLFQLLDKVAKTELPVYIYGESGTGKELIAKAIHYNSSRRKKHFVPLNCAAIPETLLESELFGYEKGAFTGADTTKKGLFEIASGGTFFLDEISNMSEAMQQTLLRALEEKEIRRIGGKRSIRINTRIISASNKNPQELVKAGTLREDLFYRLNVLAIELPALREKREDIPLLVKHFWDKAATTSLHTTAEEKRGFLKVLLAFMNYDWPGNVRELENEIYRIASLGEGVLNIRYLSPHFLKDSIPGQISGRNMRLSLEETEKSFIKAALLDAKGNKARAAKLLGIPRSTLCSKIEKYGISAARSRLDLDI